MSADNQVVLGGLAAVVALFGLFAWNAWGDGDEDLATIGSSVLADPGAAVEESASPFGGDGGIVETVTAGDDAQSTTTASTEAPSTTVEAAAVEGVDNRLVILEPQVSAALTDVGVVDAAAAGVGTEVTVTGTIQSEDARQAALDAVAAVDGVTGVTDQFAAGETPETLQANRIVLFTQTG